MGVTANGIVFPDDTDTVDVAADMEALAESVDTLIAGLFSAWSTWTPSLVGTTSGGSLGNATVVARYKHLGRLVVAEFDITLGSTTSMGVGNTTIALPTAARATTPGHVGDGIAIDNSPSVREAGIAIELDTVSRVILVREDGGLIGPSVPWTWTTSDVLRGRLVYEAAAGP